MRRKVLPLLLLSFWTVAYAGPQKTAKPPKTPENMGPATIDVSSYPEDLQQTYRDVFLKAFGYLGGPAAIVNSPIIEMDEKLEARERRENPELFSDANIAEVSRDGWKKKTEEIYHRPPCCGACPLLNREQAKALWHFLVYDSIHRKTGPKAKAWIEFRKDLLKRFNEYQRRITS